MMFKRRSGAPSWEALFADATSVGPGARVSVQVPAQMLAATERLSTLRTVQRSRGAVARRSHLGQNERRGGGERWRRPTTCLRGVRGRIDAAEKGGDVTPALHRTSFYSSPMRYRRWITAVILISRSRGSPRQRSRGIKVTRVQSAHLRYA